MSEATVAVLSGGLSHEREVSLRSGRRLAESLRSEGFSVHEWDTDTDLVDRLNERRPDAAVMALHGGAGENGAIQAVLELLNIPFVGTSSAGCRQAWDKPIAKALMAEEKFHTPQWTVLPHTTFRELGAKKILDAIVARIGLPLILKPAQGGSALGAQVVREAADLPSAMVNCFGYGDTVLAEKFITGTEVSITVLDDNGTPRALPAVEIVPQSDIYDYTSRYTAGLTDFFAPARLSAEVATQVGELALAAHRKLGLRDLSRTDAIVATDGTAHFLEVNLSPGLTETSTTPMAIEAAGSAVGSVFARLIEKAIARTESSP